VSDHAAAHGHSELAHEMPVSTLISVFLALVALTLLTFDASYSISRPEYLGAPIFGTHISIFRPLFAALALPAETMRSLGVPIAMAIATVKAMLVILFFMHLRHDKALNNLIFFFCFAFFFLFIAFVLIDTLQYQGDISSFADSQATK
jgi:cytochrome c oxidase subunit IV